MRMSDDKDPSFLGSTEGAQEVYVVYGHTLDIGKLRNGGNWVRTGARRRGDPRL